MVVATFFKCILVCFRLNRYCDYYDGLVGAQVGIGGMCVGMCVCVSVCVCVCVRARVRICVCV